MERCLTLLVIREIQINAAMRHQFRFAGMVFITERDGGRGRERERTSVGENMETLGPSTGGNIKCAATVESSLAKC